jgi:hypothetical protein
MFDVIKNFFTSGGEQAKENPELDKTKEALQKLKEGTEGGLAAGILDTALEGFRKDLDELKITDPAKRAEYEGKLKETFNQATTEGKLRAIKESPELAGLDVFVNELAQYTKLNELIAEAQKKHSTDPIKNFAYRLKDMPGIGTILAYAMSWIAPDAQTPEDFKKLKPGEKAQLTMNYILNGREEELAKLQGIEIVKKDTAVVTAEKPADELTDTDKKSVEELAKNSKEGVKKAFESKGLTLDETSFDNDVLFVYKNGIKDPTEIVAMAEKATEGKALTQLKKHMGDKANQVPVTLKHAYYFAEVFNDADNQKVADNMSKIAKNDLKKMRGYLDETYKLSGNPDVLAKYVGDLEKDKANA